MAANYNYSGDAGSYWTDTVEWQDNDSVDINVAGYVFTFSFTSGDVGTATVTNPIVLSMTLPVAPGTYQYSLKYIDPSGHPDTLLTGNFIVN